MNSGRLSVPAMLETSPLNTADRAGDFNPCGSAPGTAAVDAPVTGPRGDWLLDYMGGAFTLLTFGEVVDAATARRLASSAIACRVVQVGGRAAPDGVSTLTDAQGLVAARYDGRAGTCYLLRPDQHVCARWRSFELATVKAAIARATGDA